jgi:ATP-dependent exoDNAse (exonuclease V) beta subunit
MITDTPQRQRALDITHSFIVQAPAGSGKTELLTQRFLALLASVERTPEQIVAITFTRKAAQEMRTRIINALLQATEPEPKSAHAQKTWQLARAVLLRDEQEQWELLANPNRLIIKTIDSLCASITQQMPILSEFGAQPAITDKPYLHYLEAAKQVLESGLKENVAWQEAVRIVLTHLDNNLDKVQQLLATMLSHREQWLGYVTGSQSESVLRKKLENTLKNIIDEELAILAQAFYQLDTSDSGEAFLKELFYLSQFAASNSEPDSHYRQLEKITSIPQASYKELAQWQLIASWLLTKEGTLRKPKGITKKEGFPAPSSSKNKIEKELWQDAKQRMSDLLIFLQESTNIEEKLNNIQALPSAEYSEESWQLISALLTLLPIAAAYLIVIFSKRGEVDFGHITQAALRAIHHNHAPTDLALVLDYRIQHILIDEFQDTSFVQWELIERLTAGWQPDDGRTLFLVGDPMQSIYRFRQAEVGLFLQAQQQGIGEIRLEPLSLTSNFRSQNNLIEQINFYFAKIFPKESNLKLGAVNYMPSVSPFPITEEKNPIVLHLVNSIEEEAACTIDIVKKYYEQDDKSTIAILVRARTHLIEILPLLNQANIPYSAIEIESLSERPVIQDLLALTCALLHLADKTAWLSVLRAPWCGLLLDELVLLSEHDSIWQALNDNNLVSQCSDETQLRIERLRKIIEVSLKEQGRQTLRDWIYSAWLALGGPAFYASETEQENAATFFELIDALTEKQESLDRLSVYEAIEQLYAKNSSSQNARVQVMTVHKAKGLEFDSVILPGMHKTTTANDTKLLNWLEISNHDNIREWLFATIPARNLQGDAIYEYIRGQHKKKEAYELARVFYVAITRAKAKVHLIGLVNQDDEAQIKKPSSNSFLGLMWPHAEIENAEFYTLKNASEIIKTDSITSPLKRFKTQWQLPQPLAQQIPFAQFGAITEAWQPLNADNPDKNYFWQENTPRCVGTLVHEILYTIGTQGIGKWHNKELSAFLPLWRVRLLELGVSVSHSDAAVQQVYRAIESILNDKIGRWILSEQHSESQCEYALSGMVKNKLVNIIIDRTFVEAETNIRWIIDYKTASPQANQSKEEFLAQETQLYSRQLGLYSHLLKMKGEKGIRAGLYFPLIKEWCVVIET